MMPKPPCPACGHPPASMIEDGYSIDLTPWWHYYAQKLNPFKRRRRMVPMEDVVPLIDALDSIESQGRPHMGGDTGCGCELCENWDQVHYAFTKFTAKHPLP